MYIAKAKRKLEKHNIIKIGITGSFGKTSTKNILTCLLEKEYKVCTTPLNYNTEMGLTKTILEKLDDHDVFIAEMGAKHKKDIEILAKILKPEYAILTTIGLQHIETFKNLQTIEDTKFELVENLTGKKIAVFNGDSLSNQKLFQKYDGQKYLACDKNGFAYAQDIVINENGSEFILSINDEKIKVKTRLLGKCNIDNIVTASALAYILGIKKKDISSAIASLQPTPHRLELLQKDNITIIDDSYNSNIIGASEALEVLQNFNGRKIVVSPGFVEMGNKQSQLNFKLGTMIADKADYFIIMNETNKNDLLSGAIAHNLDKDKIFFATTRKGQKELLTKLTTKDDVVLFENDLPDNYS
jgi:UDP-N-acetylmuramoyl-tripeptide--D-alanyl-D-alanine ligase